MHNVEGYQHLTYEDLEQYEYWVSQRYPTMERCYDDETGLVGFCLDCATYRGNTYRIYIVFPREYPDREPRGIIEPPVDDAPHRYGDGTICVHDNGYDASEWSPAIGFTLARAWLEAYEDWYFDGRDFQALKDIPQDIKDRVEALG